MTRTLTPLLIPRRVCSCTHTPSGLSNYMRTHRHPSKLSTTEITSTVMLGSHNPSSPLSILSR
ncbi:hypothetical protein BJ165DRAFT_1484117 [Panaeolus papilionaceus]|nr:hypothetical protein BJ165DRAFT_1484117 [Panaeolus papilionaceus]